MRSDHVLIGSGINALVAGTMLSLKGQPIPLLKRSDVIGSRLRTAEITLPDFQPDVMAATFVLFKTGPTGPVLGPHLARRGFEYCHSPHSTAALRTDGLRLVLKINVEKIFGFSVTWHSLFGDYHAAIVGEVERDASVSFALPGSTLWSWTTVKLLFSQVRQQRLHGLASWFGQALVPGRGGLEAGFQSPMVQALFALWAKRSMTGLRLS